MAALQRQRSQALRPITGANTISYTPTASDTGYHLVYANSAADNDGTTISDSEPTTAVTAAGTTGPGSELNLGAGSITLDIGGNTTLATSTLLRSKAK